MATLNLFVTKEQFDNLQNKKSQGIYFPVTGRTYKQINDAYIAHVIENSPIIAKLHKNFSKDVLELEIKNIESKKMEDKTDSFVITFNINL